MHIGCLNLTKLMTAVLILTSLAGCQSSDPIYKLKVDSDKRSYWARLLPSNKEAAPLIILLHDYGNSGSKFVAATELENFNSDRTFSVIAPDAKGYSFNDGSISPPLEIDDVKFIDKVISKAKKQTSISKVYVAGLGTGAHMALRLAIESQHEISGVATVSGQLFVPYGSKKLPTKSLFIYGDSDPLAPTRGGRLQIENSSLSMPPATKTANQWAQRLKCATSVSANIGGIVQQQRWTSCGDSDNMMLLHIRNMGHFWSMPLEGGVSISTTKALGPYQQRINVTEIMLDFFIPKTRISAQ
jgi:poly(3-hydroxybutyrate) depolymerase